MTSTAQYHQLLEAEAHKMVGLKTKDTRFSFARLIFFALAIASIFVFYAVSPFVAWGVCVFFIILFTISVVQHQRNEQQIIRSKQRTQVFTYELKALSLKLHGFETGAEFAEANHPYASDLDIVGPHSLFQYLNRAQTTQGQQQFAQYLLQPSPIEEIQQRQQSAAELANTPEFCYQFRCEITEIDSKRLSALANWAETPPEPMPAAMRIYRWAYLVSFFTSLALTPWFPWASKLSTTLFFANFMFHIYKASYFSTQHQQVSKAADLLKNLSKALHLWQTSTFTSPQLQQIHQQLNHNKSLSQRITQLSNIIGKWDYRLNMIVYFLLATFTVWDVLMLHRVRKWQQQNQALISQAVALIAQCEALTSLAFTKINHPQWVQPDVNEAHTFQTTNAAHPLMPEAQRVSNSFSFASEAQLAFISGSNMSGKSTFLRTLGTNTVLALAGAVVCAESFSLKPWKLFSIMRIHDSLEENTSTFYFEIKRIRQLLQHIDTHPNTFYLLDELLRGTNSVDKKQGTRALIKHLMQHPACGLVASHDLELATIEHEHPTQFTNYHFDVRIEQEEMYFDYRLNPGVCSVFNASLLLKKIGLNTQDH